MSLEKVINKMWTELAFEQTAHSMQCFLDGCSATGTVTLLPRLSSDNTCEAWASSSELSTKGLCSRHLATDGSASRCVVCETQTVVTGSKTTAYPANAQDERKQITASITSA